MFKRFRVLVLFFALLLLPLGLFLHINHNTAALMEHDEIPASIETRPMRLVSGMSADQQRCSITLKVPAAVQPLMAASALAAPCASFSGLPFLESRSLSTDSICHTAAGRGYADPFTGSQRAAAQRRGFDITALFPAGHAAGRAAGSTFRFACRLWHYDVLCRLLFIADDVLADVVPKEEGRNISAAVGRGFAGFAAAGACFVCFPFVSIELCAVFPDHAGNLFDDDLVPAADHHDAAETGDSRAAAGSVYAAHSDGRFCHVDAASIHYSGRRGNVDSDSGCDSHSDSVCPCRSTSSSGNLPAGMRICSVGKHTFILLFNL